MNLFLKVFSSVVQILLVLTFPLCFMSLHAPELILVSHYSCLLIIHRHRHTLSLHFPIDSRCFSPVLTVALDYPDMQFCWSVILSTSLFQECDSPTFPLVLEAFVSACWLKINPFNTCKTFRSNGHQTPEQDNKYWVWHLNKKFNSDPLVLGFVQYTWSLVSVQWAQPQLVWGIHFYTGPLKCIFILNPVL